MSKWKTLRLNIDTTISAAVLNHFISAQNAVRASDYGRQANNLHCLFACPIDLKCARAKMRDPQYHDSIEGCLLPTTSFRKRSLSAGSPEFCDHGWCCNSCPSSSTSSSSIMDDDWVLCAWEKSWPNPTPPWRPPQVWQIPTVSSDFHKNCSKSKEDSEPERRWDRPSIQNQSETRGTAWWARNNKQNTQKRTLLMQNISVVLVLVLHKYCTVDVLATDPTVQQYLVRYNNTPFPKSEQLCCSDWRVLKNNTIIQ